MGTLFDEGFGLLLGKQDRQGLWAELTRQVEAYLDSVEGRPVPQQATRGAVRTELEGLDFSVTTGPSEAVRWAAENLARFQLHTSHPAYYGVFNPQPSTMSLAADMLVAAFNPQLASSASALFCLEVEDHLVRWFGERFGYDPAHTEGIFTSGATEANYTSLLVALDRKLPGYREGGLRGQARWPRVYCTAESHNSILRAARVTGLGAEAVRKLPVDVGLRMDVAALRAAVAEDRAAGWLPLYVVGTMGNTSAGVVDPLAAIAEVAAAEDLWFHVDGAWGGAAALLPELAGLLAGLGSADSVAFDPHKWMSVTMGCGMFVTRHLGALRGAFALEQSAYMPDDTFGTPTTEPYQQSLQWSRRFMGLKLFLTLMVHGEAGYREVLRHQVAMGQHLRVRLGEEGWLVCNDTPLPVVCYADTPGRENVPAILEHVNASGKTWITNTVLRHDGQAVLRTGISNFATQREHVELVVACLGEARAAVQGGASAAC